MDFAKICLKHAIRMLIMVLGDCIYCGASVDTVDHVVPTLNALMEPPAKAERGSLAVESATVYLGLRVYLVSPSVPMK